MSHFAPIKRSSDMNQRKISHHRTAYMEGTFKTWACSQPRSGIALSKLQYLRPHTETQTHSDCHVPRHAKQVVFRPASPPSASEAATPHSDGTDFWLQTVTASVTDTNSCHRVTTKGKGISEELEEQHAAVNKSKLLDRFKLKIRTFFFLHWSRMQELMSFCRWGL